MVIIQSQSNSTQEKSSESKQKHLSDLLPGSIPEDTTPQKIPIPKKLPKGTALIKLIRDHFYRNEDPIMNVDKGVWLDEIYEEMIFKNCSKTFFKILMQIESIGRHEKTENKKGDLEIQKTAKYIANGIQLNKKGKVVPGKNKYGCSEKNVKRFYECFDDIYINIKPVTVQGRNGKWYRKAHKITLTPRGIETLKILRAYKFEGYFFPKIKEKHHKIGYQKTTWEKVIKASNAELHRKMARTCRESLHENYRDILFKNLGGFFGRLMNRANFIIIKNSHRGKAEKTNSYEQPDKKNVPSVGTKMSPTYTTSSSIQAIEETPTPLSPRTSKISSQNDPQHKGGFLYDKFKKNLKRRGCDNPEIVDRVTSEFMRRKPGDIEYPISWGIAAYNKTLNRIPKPGSEHEKQEHIHEDDRRKEQLKKDLAKRHRK